MLQDAQEHGLLKINAVLERGARMKQRRKRKMFAALAAIIQARVALPKAAKALQRIRKTESVSRNLRSKPTGVSRKNLPNSSRAPKRVANKNAKVTQKKRTPIQAGYTFSKRQKLLLWPKNLACPRLSQFNKNRASKVQVTR